MAVIVKDREHIAVVEYRLNFLHLETNEVEWSFPLLNGENTEPVSCYKDCSGEWVSCKISECPWWENYLRISSDNSYRPVAETLSFDYWNPAVLRCDCGKEIVLDSNTIPCPECGAYYNQWGQRLEPSACCRFCL